jgi:Ca2+-binding EF-hand superfamily protein
MKTNSPFAWTFLAVLLIAMMLTITTASGQKSSSSHPAPKLSLSSLDTDQDGTVSKQEFMVYMDAQFERVDTDHDGTLDKTELEQLRKNLAIATK